VFYFLDGYNILFNLTDSDSSLSTQRQKIIHFFRRRFALFKIEGMLVFDGRVRRGEESGRAYSRSLEVIYTPKGQSADHYIISCIEISEKPRQITVVTNDRGLIANAKSLGTKAIGNEEFIQWLLNRKKKPVAVKPEIADTKQNIQRLLAIFEKRLYENDN
jgi:predicted RNA-binding protein with PIN domain